MKRILALLLSLVMLLTLIPAAAAEDIEIIDPEQEPARVGALDDPLTDPADEIAVVDPEAPAEEPEDEPEEPTGTTAPNAILDSGDCGDIYEWYSETEYKRYDVKWVLTTDGVLTISGTGRMGWDGDCPWNDYRTNITSVVIKSGVTYITGFKDCTRLKSVTIPATVTELNWNCFSGCSALKSVKLPDGVTSVPGQCFYKCSALTSVTIPSGLTEIMYEAFYNCSALTALTLPAGLQSIGDRAFFGCSVLTGITIPAKVTEIGNAAFANCNLLSKISVASGSQSYCSAGGVLFNKNKTALIAYPGGKSGDYTIPSSVYALSPSAFRGCQKLGHITVGSHVTVIPEYCFREATLTGIALPDTLEAIGRSAFEECHGLSSITFPANLEIIEDNAFYYGSKLGCVVFHEKLKTIGKNAFYLCEIDSITFPASLESIGEWAFAHCEPETICFKGDAPNFGEYALLSARGKAYYPADASGWDKAIADINSYSNITWLPCEKPAVTTQPKKVTAYPGGTASFTAAADTYVTYQWYYRKSADSAWTKCSGSSATTDTLQISVKSYHNGYQYRCKMTNPLGSVTSHYASLTVSAPKITTQPKDLTVPTDSMAKFTVKAEGAKSYQWYFSKDCGATWGACSNGTASTLTVEAKNYRSGYQYRCAVKNAAGTVYSNPATLRVKPGITTQPTDKTASAGASVTFTVKATGASSYQWYYRKTPTGAWNRCTDGTSATLTVEAKSYRDGFQYRCKVTNEVGSVYTNAVTLTVNTPTPPIITEQPEDRYESPSGMGIVVSFHVEASGDSLSYQWQFSKDGGVTWNKCTDGTSATLLVEIKTYRDGYQYRCKVTNEAGSVYSEAATLHVE